MKNFNFKKLTVFITPLVFVVLGYFILYFSAKSVINPVINIWSMMATDIRIGQEDGLTDIYEGKVFDTYTETVKSSTVTFPTFGTKYGEISIDGTDVNCPLYFGDDSKCLRAGVGQYLGSSFPGMGSTVLIGGHNNSYFKTLKDAQIGSIITVNTNYGSYKYRITSTAIKESGDKTAYDINSSTENIVLYTCYPFDMLGLTKQRYFVYGEYVSGPKILLNE